MYPQVEHYKVQELKCCYSCQHSCFDHYDSSGECSYHKQTMVEKYTLNGKKVETEGIFNTNVEALGICDDYKKEVSV